MRDVKQYEHMTELSWDDDKCCDMSATMKSKTLCKEMIYSISKILEGFMYIPKEDQALLIFS